MFDNSFVGNCNNVNSSNPYLRSILIGNVSREMIIAGVICLV